MSKSLQPHGLQHARLLCPSPFPGVCTNTCPLRWWCYLTISSSTAPFSFCLQSFPALESFPMSWLFASCSQGIGASALAAVLIMNIQGWLPFRIHWCDLLVIQGTLRVKQPWGWMLASRFCRPRVLSFALILTSVLQWQHLYCQLCPVERQSLWSLSKLFASSPLCSSLPCSKRSSSESSQRTQSDGEFLGPKLQQFKLPHLYEHSELFCNYHMQVPLFPLVCHPG